MESSLSGIPISLLIIFKNKMFAFIFNNKEETKVRKKYYSQENRAVERKIL